MNTKIIHGDCKEKIKELPDCSVSAIITDPPYELNFMGSKWDRSGIAYDEELWRECLRVMKPGGHMFVFGATRTAHRVACAIEDAGFTIRDYIEWCYASGFPKAHDISKKLGETWKGYKTNQLKPSHEPIYIAQKPLIDEGEPNTIDWDASFFYCAKVGKKERNMGCKEKGIKSNHPTVKPQKLMKYLVTLVSPPKEYKKDFVVLDPFNGSGSTGMACKALGVNYIGIEQSEEYCKIAQARIDAVGEPMEDLFDD